MARKRGEWREKQRSCGGLLLLLLLILAAVNDLLSQDLFRNKHAHKQSSLGDAFVVTADSVSMISEASSIGKPVYVVRAER